MIYRVDTRLKPETVNMALVNSGELNWMPMEIKSGEVILADPTTTEVMTLCKLQTETL
jgi:hypothetical protein